MTNKSSINTGYILLPLPFLHTFISCSSRLLRKESLYFQGVKRIGSPLTSNDDNFAGSAVAWPKALLLGWLIPRPMGAVEILASAL